MLEKSQRSHTASLLTQLGELSVEGAPDRPAAEGQPGQTVVAHGVTAEQQARDLVPLQREDVLAHTALENLENFD